MFRSLSAISIGVLLILILTGCDGSNLDPQVRLPLYESCEATLPQYRQKLERFGYDVGFVVERFSTPTAAHPGLVGMLKVTGSLSSSELDEVLNGLRIICLPQNNFARFNASELGLKGVLTTLQEAHDRGKREVYTVLEDDQITVYFNDATEEHKRLALEFEER